VRAVVKSTKTSSIRDVDLPRGCSQCSTASDRSAS
jgi:hypothetical protein